MYALVNTMSKSESSLGTVVSRHRTVASAVKAERKLQDAVKLANGSTSYVPTLIAHIHTVGGTAAARSSRADRSLFTAIDSEDYFFAQVY
jgi:hypothetical protein